MSRINYVTQLCFFFNDTATTEIYTLSLHDALPISLIGVGDVYYKGKKREAISVLDEFGWEPVKLMSKEGLARSEEHTSELQSRQYLVCRLLLEKKKKDHKS